MVNIILSPQDENILLILPHTLNFQLCSIFEKLFEKQITSISNIIRASIPTNTQSYRL